MLHRRYARLLRDKLKKYPAVALLGPRQCGKTTLAKCLGGEYFDLETAGDATRLDAEWDTLIRGRRLVILDEAQGHPPVFARLRGAIDADRKRKGRFLLLGSVSPALMTNVSESLAGRLGLAMMTPFLLPELKVQDPNRHWLHGGYPDGGILDSRMFPEWQRDYLNTLIMRDLPSWGLPARPQLLSRLLHMLAALQGQPMNASQLGASLSLDHKTVTRYGDCLEGAFLLRRLPPYFANVKKRLVKSPRLYWRDSGLLHSLMGVETMEQLYRQPWVGASWEGYVIEQTLAWLTAQGKQVSAYFLRTSDGHELDLVLETAGRLTAVEIKLTSNPSPEDVARLHKAADLIQAERRVLVCRVTRKVENQRLLVTGLPDWLRTVSRWKSSR